MEERIYINVIFVRCSVVKENSKINNSVIFHFKSMLFYCQSVRYSFIGQNHLIKYMTLGSLVLYTYSSPT